jgi:uncharacterized membrane protein
MKRSHLVLLVASCFVAVLTVATSDVTRFEFAKFEFARVALGLLLVLVVPGFALVSAALPKSQFSFGEYVLASVGASLAISTISAVSLGAAPVGLTRLSLSIVLGSCTVVLSIAAVMRSYAQSHPRETKGHASN